MIPTTTSSLVISKFLRKQAAISRGGVYKSDRKTLVYKNHLILACWRKDELIVAPRDIVDSAKQYKSIQLLIGFASIRKVKLYVARKSITISPTIKDEYIKRYSYKRNEYLKFQNCGLYAKQRRRTKAEMELAKGDGVES